MNGKLIVSEGGRERVHELLDDITVVGRGERADLRLKDQKAAALHCEIRRTPGGFKLVDLETRDGTRVNGEHVNARLLEHGDTIAVGGVEITYLGDSPTAKPAPAPAAGLREVPRDESGKPKGFYRHEAKPMRRTGGSGAGLGIAALCLSLAGVVAWSLSDGAEESTQKAKYREAVELLRNVDSEDKAKRILKLLGELDPAVIDPRDVGRMRAEAKEHLDGFAHARVKQDEYAQWNELADLYQKRPERTEEILARADKFLLEHPQSDKAEQAAKIRRFIQLGGDPSRELEKMNAAINAALATRNYVEAFAALKAMDDRPLVKKEIAKSVEASRRILEDKFGAYVADRFKAAQQAAAGGDPALARKIYGEIAAFGVAPYDDTAKRALAALK
jgi:hypothetical protein